MIRENHSTVIKNAFFFHIPTLFIPFRRYSENFWKQNMDKSAESALRIRIDNQLVDEALEHGDQKAYATLMEHHKDSLYYMIFKMVNNPYEAEDLTIEAFGKAFRNLSNYTKNYAFSTWLYSIAANNCIDYLRKKRLNCVLMDDTYETEDDVRQPYADIPDNMLSPEEKLCKKEGELLLRRYVGMLKEEYRTLIEMRYFQELSYEEIATRTNLPLGTVKNRLFKAKNKLQEIIQKQQHEETT